MTILLFYTILALLPAFTLYALYRAIAIGWCFLCWVILAPPLLFTACAAQGGLKNAGSVTLPDGRSIVGIEASTTMEGPQLVVLQTYACTGQDLSDPDSKATCTPEHQYQTGGPSLGQSALTAFVGGAASGLSLGLPAALLRPDQNTIEQHGGGAELSNTAVNDLSSNVETTNQATSSSASYARAKASAKQRQGQRQAQTQQPAMPMGMD